MIKYAVAAISAILLSAANLPAKSDTLEMPAERIFSSSVGEVTFKHQLHVQERGIQCVECHHQINAKTLKTPHPDYFKSSAIKCEICHDGSEKIKQKAYTCSGCHPANPAHIADETLSAKVVIHKQCWKCHAVGTGKEASKGCDKCHSGKKKS
jgi:DnaJ-class molecular chaperone